MSFLKSIIGRVPRPRLSYANVAASLALFMALSGVAWAASLPRNSVGTKQLKRNAVTSSKVKNGSLTGSDVKNNSLSGSDVKNNSIKGVDVNESTLEKVPTASAADTVGTDIGPIAVRLQSSASAATEAAARAAAAEVPLLTVGQVSLYAKCFVETTGNTLRSEVIMRTTADGAVGISTEDTLDGDLEFLNVATAEDARQFDTLAVAADDASIGGDDRATLIGPDGNGLQAQVSIWGKHGTIPGASSMVAGTDQCYISLTGKRLSPPA
jgi:hypothetical protein